MNIVNAPLGKRILAVFIDLFLMVILFFVFQDLVVTNLTKVWTDKMEYYEKYKDYFEEVPLYEYDEDSKTFIIVEEENYLVTLEEFYDVYLVNEQPDVDYPTWKEVLLSEEDGPTIYEEVGGVIVLKEGITEEEVTEFLTIKYENALQIFYEIPEIHQVVSYLTSITIIEVGTSVFFSMLILYFTIPLFLRNGRTIGKLVFGLAVVSKNGYKMTILQHIVRFICMMVFEVFLATYTFLLNIFVSFTMAVFSKRNTSLHDFLSLTVVIDLKKSVIFETKEQEENYRKSMEVQDAFPDQKIEE